MDLNSIRPLISSFLRTLSSQLEAPPYDEGLIQGIYVTKINKSKAPFSTKTLKKLDFSCYFDQYLLPHLNSSRDPPVSNSYFFSLIALINHKFGEHILFWDYIRLSSEEISMKFKLIMKFILSLEYSTLSHHEKTQILIFLNQHFKYIEKSFLSEELMKLVSPYLFQRIHKIYLKKLFLSYPKLITLYQTVTKSDETQNITNTQINFFPNLLQDFLTEITENLTEKTWGKPFETYIYRCLQLLTDLLSQITTRRFLKYLLEAEYVIPLLRSIKLERFNISFLCLIDDLEYYLKYPINEETGEAQNFKVQILLRSDFLKQLQFILFKLMNMTPSVSEIESLDFVKLLDLEKDMPTILKHLDIRVPKNYANISNEELLLNIFRYIFPPKPNKSYKELPLIPSDELLWDYKKIPDENFNEILSLPKLNLQFLDFQDYLFRNFLLFRLESAYEIRYDLEDSIRRMGPRFNAEGVFQGFNDWARMATKLNKLVINEIAHPLLGHKEPARVFSELLYSTKEMPNYVKKEWESLREHEVLFLVSFGKRNNKEILPANHKKESMSMEIEEHIIRFKEHYGVKYVRGCEIMMQYDEKHKQISFEAGDKKKINPEGFERTINVLLDPFQYREDLEKVQQSEIYSDFQLIIRRKPKENNFKSILATISDLMNEKLELPEFLNELILGYGECENSTTQFRSEKDSKKFHFFDTFIDENHYKEAFVLNERIPKNIKDWAYEPFEKKGLECKRNNIRFNERQIEAIYYSMQHGVSLIVGPPGTGKTDVAVQIANLLYNNNKNERTLIITHSNYALNDIFEKIVRLDIDERHLLRLGLGEKDLDLGKNFSKHGRINYLLERRLHLLREVKIFSQSIQPDQDEDYTCETAEILFQTKILPKWQAFKLIISKQEQNDRTFYLARFPFNKYLKESTMFFFGITEINHENEEPLAHINLDVKSIEDLLNLFQLIWDRIVGLFTELKELALLEILRSNKERGNYLISQQAKIIAMTSTHAAMKRKNFLEIGFEYDNVIFEESAQIMEIESFIPLVLQNSRFQGKQPRLKRVIMLGDENQLPPIIKNTNYQKLSNLEQSLFTRLLRLNTPHVKLTHQGRCRESILELFQWKYEKLLSLPVVSIGDYSKMNCGFLNEYQFIDVPEIQGVGETCPNPHFYQNIAEAEFVVSTYMYMVLKGYDPNTITILTTYNGQKYLIRDIIHQKCSWSKIFRKPKKITTVDKFQGQQNDYILLSLVRTKNVGHIRDPRRLIVAMSRAKLGLYVFGKFHLYQGYNEMKEIFKLFGKKSLKMELIVNENWETRRNCGEKTDEHTNYERMGRKSVGNHQEMYAIVEKLLKEKMKDF